MARDDRKVERGHMPTAVERTSTANQAEFLFKIGEGEYEQLKVTEVTGSEGLSELYAFRIDVCSDERELDGNALLAKPCVLKMDSAGGVRYVHGVVRAFERIGDGNDLTYYGIDVVPIHWMMTKRIGCTIYQEHMCSDMTIPGIIKKVLLDAGIQADYFRFALQRAYPKREYVVQYRESEYDFIARLMEEEGIFYYFEHQEGRHVMVFGDMPSAHQPVSDGLGPDAAEDAATVPYRTRSGLLHEKEYIYELSEKHEVQIGRTLVDDYDFTRPDKQLRSYLEAGDKTYLSEADYPGNYCDKPTGQRYAQQRLEAHQWQRRVVKLGVVARSMMSGYKFTLCDHPVEKLNQEYLITQVEHYVRQSSAAQENREGESDKQYYEAKAKAIPATVPYRPRRMTEKPCISGTQTALVVGPKSEEIYTDKYGRVKVQFHWDQAGRHDENSSCWIRVCQAAAGGQYGMMFLPRVGQEVVIGFLEGDPDKPVITGRVYNADNMPPYDLPAKKSCSGIKSNSSKGGGGTNEIVFEDSKDCEKFSLHAQKDFHVRVTKDRIEAIEHDDNLAVGNDKLVQIGRDLSTQIAGKETREVASTYSLTVSDDAVLTFGKNVAQTVSDTLAITADKIKLEAGSAIELTCGSALVVLKADGTIVIKGSKVLINSGGGSAVTDPSCKATKTQKPKEADDSTPGGDVTYTMDPNSGDPIKVEPAPPKPGPPKSTKKKSWVKIRLLDEEQKPCPGEKYRVTTPEGNVHEGSLDANGMAHIGGIDPGMCQITFPELDRTAWHRQA
jgi:type VI secretion system secreted protein VgrG